MDLQTHIRVFESSQLEGLNVGDLLYVIQRGLRGNWQTYMGYPSLEH